MAEQKFTRCPGCGTVFRITAAQLALREGQVRCGHCRAVFDANDHFVALDADRDEDDPGLQDELAMGRPTVTLRSADALQPAPGGIAAASTAVDVATADAEAAGVADTPPIAVPPVDVPPVDVPPVDEAPVDEAPVDEAPVDEAPVDEAPVDALGVDAPALEGTHESASVDEHPAEATADKPSAEAPAPIDIGQMDRGARFEWKKPRPRVEHSPLVAGATIALLLIALGLQAVLEYRETLVAHVPAMRPVLAGACGLLGCTIGPLRDTAALSIDASDLQADPAHRGLLLLTATIRNRAAYALAYPYVELTLTDASDQVVVRRAFAPADYAGGTADPDLGIAANGEKLVRLFIDASATAQAGYRLYLFYP
jgi:predicted Zn finger-like uncharacterized protein